MTIAQRTTTLDKPAGTTDEQMLPPDWMMFPTLNEAWIQSAEGTIALMAERINTFQALTSSAPPAERVRTRLIAQSYIQVHTVLQELNATYKKTASAESKAI
ncbi:MAG TPA: hypothetical protein VK638_10585 [Edaphobacter sp.]|nr:hypothetical protein [Edaphobacter sp.]